MCSVIAAGAGSANALSESRSHSTVSNPQPQPVTVRVLSGPTKATYSRQVPAEVKVNFNVKILNPENKKEQQVFVLRDVNQAITSTPETLREELRKQFGSHVRKKYQFPLGYRRGSLKVSPADMSEVWQCASRGKAVVLWCEGVGYHARSDSDDEFPKKRRKKKRKMSALEEKNDRIEDIVRSLREKHGDHYTAIQYRLWAEMTDIGMHR